MVKGCSRSESCSLDQGKRRSVSREGLSALLRADNNKIRRVEKPNSSELGRQVKVCCPVALPQPYTVESMALHDCPKLYDSAALA